MYLEEYSSVALTSSAHESLVNETKTPTANTLVPERVTDLADTLDQDHSDLPTEPLIPGRQTEETIGRPEEMTDEMIDEKILIPISRQLASELDNEVALLTVDAVPAHLLLETEGISLQIA